MKTSLITLALGTLTLVVGALGYHVFARQRLRKQFHVDNISEQWLSEQRRER
jgi:hypothetical protein